MVHLYLIPYFLIGFILGSILVRYGSNWGWDDSGTFWMCVFIWPIVIIILFIGFFVVRIGTLFESYIKKIKRKK